MRTLIVLIGMIVAVAVIFSGICLADEDDIFKKHEKRMEKILIAQEQAKAMGYSIDMAAKKKDKPEIPLKDPFTSGDDYTPLIQDLAEFLGAKENHISVVSVTNITNAEWGNKYNDGGWAEVMFGNYIYKEVTLEYKGKGGESTLYSYGIVGYTWPGDTQETLEVSATLDPAMTGGVEHRITIPIDNPYSSVIHFVNDHPVIFEIPTWTEFPLYLYKEGDPLTHPTLGDPSVIITPSVSGGETLERLEVVETAQAQTKGATFTGQMAGETGEVLPLQKKQ